MDYGHGRKEARGSGTQDIRRQRVGPKASRRIRRRRWRRRRRRRRRTTTTRERILYALLTEEWDERELVAKGQGTGEDDGVRPEVAGRVEHVAWEERLVVLRHHLRLDGLPLREQGAPLGRHHALQMGAAEEGLEVRIFPQQRHAVHALYVRQYLHVRRSRRRVALAHFLEQAERQQRSHVVRWNDVGDRLAKR